MADMLEGRRILLTTDAVGGVWTYSLDLARGLGSAGAEVVLAVMGPAPCDAQQAAAESVPGITLIHTDLPLDWLAETPDAVTAAGRDLAELAAGERCDLVQLHAAAFAASGGFAMPVVAAHHSCHATWWAAVKPGVPLPEEFRWRTALVAEGLRTADAVLAPSTAHAHAVAHAYGLRSPPLAIRNGRSAADGEPSDVRERAPFVFTSGRLWDEGKNAAALDRAAAHLGVPVVAAGAVHAPGGETGAFAALQLQGVLGEEAMRLWLSQAPVYASAALYEPFGLGVLEAAQAGCALVLSDIPSFRELWSGACLFVPPDDDAAIAVAIRSLLDEPARLRRMSERAWRRARHYSLDAMVRQTVRLHANLLALEAISRGAAA